MVGHEFPPLIGSDGVRCAVEISQDLQATVQGIIVVAIPPVPKGFKQLNKINSLGKAITLGVLQNPPECSDGFLYVLGLHILQAVMDIPERSAAISLIAWESRDSCFRFA